MENFKVIIAGDRNFSDYQFLSEKVSHYLQPKLQECNVIIVSGNAKGADALGERFAQEHNLQVELHPAEWGKYGRAAGPKRNRDMALAADALIAFWDGKSRGTKNMIMWAKREKLEIHIISY